VREFAEKVRGVFASSKQQRDIDRAQAKIKAAARTLRQTRTAVRHDPKAASSNGAATTVAGPPWSGQWQIGTERCFSISHEYQAAYGRPPCRLRTSCAARSARLASGGNHAGARFRSSLSEGVACVSVGAGLRSLSPDSTVATSAPSSLHRSAPRGLGPSGGAEVPKEHGRRLFPEEGTQGALCAAGPWR
jgi:hypothetical protein